MSKLDPSKKNLKGKAKNSKNSNQNNEIGKAINNEAEIKVILLKSIIKDLIFSYVPFALLLVIIYLLFGYLPLVIGVPIGILLGIFLIHHIEFKELKIDTTKRIPILLYKNDSNSAEKRLKTYLIPAEQWNNIYKSNITNPILTKWGHGYIAKNIKFFGKKKRIVSKIEFEDIHLRNISFEDMEEILKFGKKILENSK